MTVCDAHQTTPTASGSKITSEGTWFRSGTVHLFMTDIITYPSAEFDIFWSWAQRIQPRVEEWSPCDVLQQEVRSSWLKSYNRLSFIMSSK